MWYTAKVTMAYGTGAGYDGAPAHAYTTVQATVMSHSPKAALREARRRVLFARPSKADVPGSEDWYWIPVAEEVSLRRDGVRLIHEVN